MKRIKDLIDERLTTSVRRFASDVGLSRQTVANVMNGKTTPAMETIKRVCAYFGEDWHEYEEKKKIGVEKLEDELVASVDRLNEVLYALGSVGVEYFDGNEEKHSRTSVVGWLCLDTKKKEITVLPF